MLDCAGVVAGTLTILLSFEISCFWLVSITALLFFPAVLDFGVTRTGAAGEEVFSSTAGFGVLTTVSFDFLTASLGVWGFGAGVLTVTLEGVSGTFPVLDGVEG